MCLGSNWFVTPEEFGYSRKQSAQCSHSSRSILGLCSHSGSSLSGKRCISGLDFTAGCWAGTGNVGLTGAPSMFEAEIHHWGCLWGNPKDPHIPGGLHGHSCPVTEQGTHGSKLPSSSGSCWGSPPHFVLADIGLGRLLVFNKPILKIQNLFLEFCLIFFYSFSLL